LQEKGYDTLFHARATYNSSPGKANCGIITRSKIFRKLIGVRSLQAACRSHIFKNMERTIGEKV